MPGPARPRPLPQAPAGSALHQRRCLVAREIQTYFTAFRPKRRGYLLDINAEPKHAGAIAKEFGNLVRAFVHADTTPDGVKYYTPTALKAELDRWKPEFKGNQHQDSHDFLHEILSALHEGLKSDGESIVSRLFSIVREPKMYCATPWCKGERPAATERATSICVEIPKKKPCCARTYSCRLHRGEPRA